MSIVKKNFIMVFLIVSSIIFSLLNIIYHAVPIYSFQIRNRELTQNFQNILHRLEGEKISQMIEILIEQENKNNELFLSLTDSEGSLYYPRDIQTISDDTPNENISNVEFRNLTEIVHTDKGEKLILIGQFIPTSLSFFSQFLLTYYPFIIVFFILISGTLLYLYSFYSAKRIRFISEQTRQMLTHSQNIRCRVKGNDEIARLSQDIDKLYTNLLCHMAHIQNETQKIKQREAEKLEFLRITSHELKTPITSMLGIVEGMQYQVGVFKDYDKYLAILKQFLQDQADMVNTVLNISSLEIELKQQIEEIELHKLIVHCLQRYEFELENRNLNLIQNIEPYTIKISGIYMEKVFQNLLDNAFRYTPSQGQIYIELKNGYFKIKNHMVHALSQNQLEKLSKPFYRPDYSRNRKLGGSGLGIYMVDQILKRQKIAYCISLEDNYFVFSIDFSSQVLNLA